MTQKPQNAEQRFWSGYALGAFTAGVAAYAFGTKTGRTKVRNLMDIIDSHSDPSELVDSLSTILPEVLKNVSQDNGSNINQVISKMRNISSEDHKTKKFITK